MKILHLLLCIPLTATAMEIATETVPKNIVEILLSQDDSQSWCSLPFAISHKIAKSMLHNHPAVSYIYSKIGCSSPSQYEKGSCPEVYFNGYHRGLEHLTPIRSVYFNAAGDRVVTMDSHGVIKIWDLEGKWIDGTRSSTMCNSAHFAVTQNWIIILSDAQAKRLNVGEECLGYYEGKHVAESKRIIQAGVCDFKDRSSTFATVEEVKVDEIYSAHLNGSRGKIVTTLADNTVRICDLEGNCLATLIGHEKKVYSTRFNGQGDRIITTSEDETARVWDLKGNCLAILTFVTSAASFNGAGDKIVAGTSCHEENENNYLAALWDLKHCIASYKTEVKQKETHVHDLKGCGPDVYFKGVYKGFGHKTPIHLVHFNAAGDRVVTMDSQGIAMVWDLEGRWISSIGGRDIHFSSAYFSVTRNRIILLLDGEAKRLNVGEECLGYYEGKHVAECKRMIRAGVYGFKDESGGFVTDKEVKVDEIYSAHLNGSRGKIVTTSADNTVGIYDLEGNCLATLIGHEKKVYSARFNGQGDRIITTSEDKTARVWDLEGNCLAMLKWVSVYAAPSFNGAGDKIVAATYCYSVAALWDLKHCIASYEAHCFFEQKVTHIQAFIIIAVYEIILAKADVSKHDIDVFNCQNNSVRINKDPSCEVKKSPKGSGTMEIELDEFKALEPEEISLDFTKYPHLEEHYNTLPGVIRHILDSYVVRSSKELKERRHCIIM